MDPFARITRKRPGGHLRGTHTRLAVFRKCRTTQQKLGEIQNTKSLIIDMRDVRYLDQSGVYTRSDLIEDMVRRGATVYLCEMHEEPS
ncbi:MAG TPA: sodium-independent anion transporter [candidate division Zixibacteria bacterium]|nr:sodium-independent anion transporter [candidate division Zixibacteria bacterium]